MATARPHRAHIQTVPAGPEDAGMHANDTRGRAAARSLRPRLDGGVHLPGDGQYEVERLGWNRTIDSTPAVIAAATSPEDVRVALVVARELDLSLAVQATGHGSVVACDEGFLLKTTAMAEVRIDPEHRLARVGPGATWEQVNAAAAPYGLAALAGRCATVGVTGYTLGGGTGWLSRRFGYAADSVVSAQVVTAEGKLVTAAADENPDLFWALRGGGGNFGVVTSLEFRLYPAARLFAGMSFYRLDRGRAVLDAYRHWALDEPDEMNSAVLLMRLPPAPSIPEPLRGQQVLAIRAFHLGPEEGGRRLLAPLLDAAGPPLAERFGTMTFPQASSATNGPDVPPMATRQHVDLFHEMPDDGVDAIVEAGSPATSPLAFVELRHWGGAMADPPPDAGPAGARDARFSVMAVAAYPTPERAPVDAHVDHLAARMRPASLGTSFLTLLTDSSRTRTAFTDASWDRLVEAKRTWDPDNLFHLNHNIPPGVRAPAPTQREDDHR
jgi:hypothetical protein